MTHKQTCINHAQEFLLSMGLQDYWCNGDFSSYYRKHDGANGNPYLVGLNAADYIINQASYKRTPQEVEN